VVSLGLLVLRLIVGGIMAVHGYAKVFGGEGKGEKVSPEAEKLLGKGFAQHLNQGGMSSVAGVMQHLQVPSPTPAAAALMAAELGGGLALILGWHTRPAALALTVSQLVAIQKVHGPHGMMSGGEVPGWELNAALAAATGALFLTGPGALALD
jgi:uncharacterized membrane protein YphA (DoxX/SURF4 family)